MSWFTHQCVSVKSGYLVISFELFTFLMDRLNGKPFFYRMADWQCVQFT